MPLARGVPDRPAAARPAHASTLLPCVKRYADLLGKISPYGRIKGRQRAKQARFRPRPPRAGIAVDGPCDRGNRPKCARGVGRHRKGFSEYCGCLPSCERVQFRRGSGSLLGKRIVAAVREASSGNAAFPRQCAGCLAIRVVDAQRLEWRAEQAIEPEATARTPVGVDRTRFRSGEGPRSIRSQRSGSAPSVFTSSITA